MGSMTAASPVAHQTVLRAELVDSVLNDRSGAYIDATFGRGGHSRALLERLAADARLLVLDRDPEAVAAATEFAAADDRVQACHARFGQIAHVAGLHDMPAVAGILLDLGVSSPQLDQAARGFSFRNDGPLDMRMDSSAGTTAAQWLNSASVADMARVFREYGEERHAKRIALAIERARPLTTTGELARIVDAAQPRPDRHKHAATRVFQAVRMHVNDELGELAEALEQGWALLRPGGRMAVISFHSLEDRLVKQSFAQRAKPPQLPRRLPVTDAEQGTAAARLLGRQRPSQGEVERNPRARSAVLRTLERVA